MTLIVSMLVGHRLIRRSTPDRFIVRHRIAFLLPRFRDFDGPTFSCLGFSGAHRSRWGFRSRRWTGIGSVAVAVLWFSCLSGCASYQFGTRSLYRPDVSTVSVPIFEADSLRRDLGERLTEAVVREIELKTPYKVVDGRASDSVLAGRILSDTKYVVGENVNDEPRDIELEMFVEVRWRDRRGDLIAESYSLAVPDSLITFGQAVHLVPEGGQSVATAQLQTIERLAEQIVAQMEVPW